MKLKYIYLIQEKNTNNYKIGVSIKPEQRIKNLRTGNTKELVLVEKYLCQNPTKVETAFHNMYNISNINKEWFELNEEEVNKFLINAIKIDSNLTKIKYLND